MKYLAKDGAIFDTPFECARYEAQQAFVEKQKMKKEIEQEVDKATQHINELLSEYFSKFPEDLVSGPYAGFSLQYRA